MIVYKYNIVNVTKTESDTSEKSSGIRGAFSPAFLLAQVGAHAAAKFAERLETIGLVPAHAGVLRLVQASEGLSQQALGLELRVLPSRLVVLIDELEKIGLIERRDHPSDRRSHALYLTDKGRETMKAVGRLAREHQDVLCAALNEKERAQLASLLQRIAEDQGLRLGVHPGFSRLRP
ncbi:MAG: MarR family winged helix-turn-helix transcriptional regulator [Bryobacteraceae bacterium]